MTGALTIQARREGDYTIVTVVGEIDITTAAELRTRLFELADIAPGRPPVLCPSP